ncbi:hypothetical protein PG988_007574 [Apiospora saccharicola]
MASAPETETDANPGSGLHTKPGDGQLTIQPQIHETLATLAAYLGFGHIADLKQCLFSIRVVTITRLLWPLVAVCSDRGHLDKIFAWFNEIGSDFQFRAHYARSDDVVTAHLRTSAANDDDDVAWEDDDDVTRAIACLLVWASDELTGARDLGVRSASLPGVDVSHLFTDYQSFGRDFDALREAVYDARGDVTCDGITLEQALGVMQYVDKIRWPEIIQPKMDHYPAYNEHPFEKYNRIVALVRGCAQEMFGLAGLAKRYDEDEPDEDAHGAANSLDKYKYAAFKAFYFFEHHMPQLGDGSDFADKDRNLPVRRGDKPAWMRPRGLHWPGAF